MLEMTFQSLRSFCAHIQMIIFAGLCSNDEEWYRLRSAVQQLMMRPKQVVPFLPSADKVALDFIDLMKGLRDHDNEVPDFVANLSRWSLECECLAV